MNRPTVSIRSLYVEKCPVCNTPAHRSRRFSMQLSDEVPTVEEAEAILDEQAAEWRPADFVHKKCRPSS